MLNVNKALTTAKYILQRNFDFAPLYARKVHSLRALCSIFKLQFYFQFLAQMDDLVS